MKLNYLVIPIVIVLVSAVGGSFTSSEIGGWYSEINKPAFTPPGRVIGLVWSAIYLMAGVSALIFWNSFPRDKKFWVTAGLFLANAALNALWSYLFFGRHSLLAATWEAGLLGLTVVVLVVLLWPRSRLAAGLLIPYAAWVFFATFLSYRVWVLNS